MEEAKIKPCGHHPDSGCTCRESNMGETQMTKPFNGGGFDMPDAIEHGDDDYLAGKFHDRGYPGYKSTSQADEIRAKANDPNMYAITHMNQAEAIKVNGKPAVWVERIAEDRITYEIQGIPHEQALRIIRDILPKVLELYLEKAKDYPAWPDLGVKGEFVEIWRKTHKLKLSVWDDQEMVSEGAMEIAKDQIAHLLLMLDCHERDK
jgi:hypothetical protein